MTEETNGAFFQSLQRNNKQIKEDRALAISEDTQIVYKREVEDLEHAIKQKHREVEQMMDLSPTNSMSLMLANEYDAIAFKDKDVALGLEIRNLKIKLEIATNRYNFLFGIEKKEDK